METPKFSPRRLLAWAALFAFTAVSAPFPLFGQDAEQEFREFIDTSGRKVEAILIDKTETHVRLKLRNGKNATFPIEKLSEPDQEFVKGWNKAKDIFLRKCSTLSVRQLLQFRGYESFKFRIQGNHIFIKGKLNDMACNFMIDTGAGGTTLYVESAKKAGCEIGPFDQVVYGIAGTAPAAKTQVKSLTMGESVILDQELLSVDLFKDLPELGRLQYDAIFGADFLSQLDAVIDYKDYRMFLKPDLSDSAEVEQGNPDEEFDFRLFKTDDGKTYRGLVEKKTTSSVTINLVNGKKIQLPIVSLSDADESYIEEWTPESDIFMRKCRSLTTQDLLELRKYQSFVYKRRGNHIFVDGKLNKVDTRFMIDTGAGTSMLHIETAKETGCNVGGMTEKIHGIGGIAPAAVTHVPSIQMGRALIENRRLLSADLFKMYPEGVEHGYGAIFGADFLRELSAVISYRENRVFLRP